MLPDWKANRWPLVRESRRFNRANPGLPDQLRHDFQKEDRQRAHFMDQLRYQVGLAWNRCIEVDPPDRRGAVSLET